MLKRLQMLISLQAFLFPAEKFVNLRPYMSEEIINKVAQSGFTTLDLETFYPENGIQVFDLKPLLFMEMIIREKDFREQLLKTEWTQYQGQVITVTCSADAIIPM